MKFRNLQASKILNTNTNRIYPVPFEVVHIFEVWFEKQFHSILPNVLGQSMVSTKTSAYLYSCWCLITAFPITYHMKKL